MADIAARSGQGLVPSLARVLLYSDDIHTREHVRFAVGSETSGREVQWTETATHAAVLSETAKKEFDLLILDGEAAKSGGMGLCRQLKHELRQCPPVLLLVGRPDDAWLATWSEADAAVSYPLDPFEVKAAVDEFFAPVIAEAHD